MFKSKKIQNLAELMLTMILTVSLVLGAAYLCERKEVEFRFHSFFEEDTGYDVIFYGTSHMIDSVYPMQLWKDYGMASYNFAVHADYLPSTYWVMQNTYDYYDPELVVIDCYTISDPYKCCSYEYLHGWMDIFPLSVNKIKAILDIANDELKDERIAEGLLPADSKGTVGEMIWTFCKYHSRWTEICEDSFNTPHSFEKGADMRPFWADEPAFAYDDSKPEYNTESLASEYLRKIIEDSLARGKKILLTYIPYSADGSRQQQAKFVGRIADEYGVDYLNFLDTDIIDYSTDMSDSTHLNVSGAHKVTDYLGNYIVTHYDIPDRSKDAAYQDWNEEYIGYTEYKKDFILRLDELNQCLLMCKDEDFDTILEVNDKSLFNEQGANNIFASMGGNLDNISEDTKYVIIHEGGKSIDYCAKLPDEYADYVPESEAQTDSSLVIVEGMMDEAMFATDTSVRMIMINRLTGETSERTF